MEWEPSISATHTLLDRPVALKLLRSDSSKHPEATERSLREGRALARLRGEHIARVLDIVVSENGPCFLILEYLEGEDLGAIIKGSGSLPINLAVTHIMQACEGLAEAHSHGIIHRDIKPSKSIFHLLVGWVTRHQGYRFWHIQAIRPSHGPYAFSISCRLTLLYGA